MIYKPKNLETRIADSLKNCASSFAQADRGRWNLSLANGKELPLSARLSDNWLLFDAPVIDHITREDLWRLLSLNATMSGFCKLILTPRGSVRLRADMPLTEEDDYVDSMDELDADLSERLSETCSNLKAAYGAFRGEQLVGHSAAISAEQTERQADELRQVCDATGWPFIERAVGKMMVELEARDSFRQAVVEQRNAGARVSVEISRFDDLEPISRQALSALLLLTGGHVRMARPSVDEQTTGRFEVMFSRLPAVSEVNHALSSLSVACAMSGREALALRDESIAGQYLAFTGLAESSANFSLPVVTNAVR